MEYLVFLVTCDTVMTPIEKKKQSIICHHQQHRREFISLYWKKVKLNVILRSPSSEKPKWEYLDFLVTCDGIMPPI